MVLCQSLPSTDLSRAGTRPAASGSARLFRWYFWKASPRPTAGRLLRPSTKPPPPPMGDKAAGLRVFQLAVAVPPLARNQQQYQRWRKRRRIPRRTVARAVATGPGGRRWSFAARLRPIEITTQFFLVTPLNISSMETINGQKNRLAFAIKRLEAGRGPWQAPSFERPRRRPLRPSSSPTPPSPRPRVATRPPARAAHASGPARCSELLWSPCTFILTSHLAACCLHALLKSRALPFYPPWLLASALISLPHGNARLSKPD